MKVTTAAAAALLASAGAAIGFALARSGGEPPPVPPAEHAAEVLVRNASGDVRAISPEDAAERIARLEASIEPRRRSDEARDAEVAAEESEADPAAADSSDPPSPLLGPDGRPYGAAELRELARSSEDATLRRLAIQALRRDDTKESRDLLQGLLADPETPASLRAEAAKALATPPHRDHLPDELIRALAAETDPAVRRALVAGVTQLRERGAWMSEITALLHDEKDPEIRKALFEAVARSARDPAARAEMLAVATSPASPPEERRIALLALTRGRVDADTAAQVTALLGDADAVVRARAIEIVAAARALTVDGLAAALADSDPSVRAAAARFGLPALSQAASKKGKPSPELRAAVARVVALATTDPDAVVRRAAVQEIGHLPAPQRAEVLEAARNDPDLSVRVTAFARSEDAVAREPRATDTFVGALESADAALRDYAYRQLQRLHAVRVPYDARWNPRARDDAVAEIRRVLASGR